jgi:hypothetical protein
MPFKRVARAPFMVPTGSSALVQVTEAVEEEEGQSATAERRRVEERARSARRALVLTSVRGCSGASTAMAPSPLEASQASLRLQAARKEGEGGQRLGVDKMSKGADHNSRFQSVDLLDKVGTELKHRHIPLVGELGVGIDRRLQQAVRIVLGPKVPEVEHLARSDIYERLSLDAKDGNLEDKAVGELRDVVVGVRDEDLGVTGVVGDVDSDPVVLRQLGDVVSVGPRLDDLWTER